MDFTGLYRVLPGFIVAAFSSVVHPSPKLAQFLDRVLPGFTGFYRVFFCTEQDFLLRVGVDGRTTDERRSIGVPIGRRRSPNWSPAACYRVLPSFPRHHPVIFYRECHRFLSQVVPRVFLGFHWVASGFIGFYLVLPSFYPIIVFPSCCTVFLAFHRVGSGCIRCNPVCYRVLSSICKSFSVFPSSWT